MERKPAASVTWSTSQVASRAGVHRDTLLRWLRQGLVKEPARDRRGWRIFSDQDVHAIIAFSHSSGEIPVQPRYTGQSKNQSYNTILNSIDWDFSQAKTDYLTHRLHPYPAKFIPQIPNALIQELSSVGDTVGDIFCGSGTTLVESLTLKRHAVGLDANPLACLISRSKTTILDANDIENLQSLAARCSTFGNSILDSGYTNDLFPRERFVSSAWRPDYDKLDFWFDTHVIEELAETQQWCHSLPTEGSRNLAITALSSVIVAMSRQDSDTRYVRRQKGIVQGETMCVFSRTLERAILAASEFSDFAEQRFRSRIVEADLLDNPNVPPLDLVVCSPPYPNAYSYHLYHQSRMIWLGMDQPRFKQQEIGSHRKYSSRGKNAATIDTFRNEFRYIFHWLSRVLKQDGFACFVVGNSTLRGQTYDNADILSDTANEAGFQEVARVARDIRSSKKSFNPTVGKIKSEKILILQNTKRM